MSTPRSSTSALLTAGRAAIAVIATAGALVALPAAAQVTTPPSPVAGDQTVQREHRVRPGDTLWDLAQLYYGNPWLWPLIYDANKPVVENPHWIFPRETLIIPGRDTTQVAPLGEPVDPAGVAVTPLQVPTDTAVAPTVEMIDLRRPALSRAEFVTAPWLSTTPEAGFIGRLVRVADPTVTSDKLPQTLYPNNKVLIGNLRAQLAAGDSVQIVRIGRGVGAHGRVVEPLGVLRVDSVGSTVVAATLVWHFGQARIGDYIMAMTPMPEVPRGALQAVDAGAEGTLLSFMASEPLYGPGDVGFVSLGRDQVRVGDELAVYIPPTRIDMERPDELPAMTVGVVKVVKVTDHSATVRVTGVRNTGLRERLPARLVRRAP